MSAVAAAPRTAPIVRVEGIGKRFAGIKALDDVTLEIERGTIHGLIGENGAGKSTLGKIVAGVIAPSEGRLLVDGEEADYRDPGDAIADGIVSVQQEIALVPKRTALENVFLGIEPTRFGLLDDAAARARYAELQEASGFAIDPEAVVGGLRVADQQKVEVLRALARNARLLVMDEPTAALTPDETESLLEVARTLRERGVTIVFVSHFLEEVLALADTVTVLRNGCLVQTTPSAGQTPERLVEAMLGRSLEQTFPERRPVADPDRVVLRARGLRREQALRDVSLEIRAGEILGVAGLVGSGRTELARAIFGADLLEAGEIELDGRPLGATSPRNAVDAGIALVPEDRKNQGLLMGRSVRENVGLAHLVELCTGPLLSRRKQGRIDELLDRLEVPEHRRGVAAKLLSGGNQQKVLFAKWLIEEPLLLLADEPTRGVDVGAKRAIYDLIADLAASGVAVLLISSELEEVLGLAHRVVVMRRGEVVAELPIAEASEDRVMRAAFGSTATAETRDKGAP
jgi:rhamnose transport system ATP-binding protein